MHPLGVVTGVGQQRIDESARNGFAQSLFEMEVIRTGSPSGHGRENQMRAALGQQPHFGKASIGHVLQAFVTA